MFGLDHTLGSCHILGGLIFNLQNGLCRRTISIEGRSFCKINLIQCSKI